MYQKQTFQEMMQRYNQELLQLQKRAQPAAPPAPRQADNTVEAFRLDSAERMSPPAPPENPPPELPVIPLPPEENPIPPFFGDDDCCVTPPVRPVPPVGECAPCETPNTPVPPECKVPDRPLNHSQTVGPTGPVLLQDGVLHETLDSFVYSNPLDRIVHTKGYGALGCFQPYCSMRKYTSACFLQDPSVITPVRVRFSLAVSNRGTPDTSRNIRGFSVKFYTRGGIYDLLCNHIPVFLVRDAMRFPEAVRSLQPSPVNNLPDPESFWSFVARAPETLNALTWLYSDAGTIASFRKMRGYGVNTFVWKNAEGTRCFVKYHWLPLAGEETLCREEAHQLACCDPDISGRDLYENLKQGRKVEYELCVQLMDPADADALPYDPLDDTKLWSESDYPLMRVGKLTLDRNPEEYAQVEQLAFSPANLVEGMELSADKMLQGRSFVYWDAQRRRLGPDFREIQVNRMPGWTPECIVTSGEGVHLHGEAVRMRIPKADDFTQAGERYRMLDERQREHLVENIAEELRFASQPTRECVLSHLYRADPDFGGYVKMWIARREE